MTSSGCPPDVSEGHPQDVGRTRSLELNIRPYVDVHIMSAGEVAKTSVGDVPWHYMRTIWGCPQNATLERPQDVIFQRSKDVGRGLPENVDRGRPLALQEGPYGDVHRTSFGDVLRMSSRRNFAYKYIVLLYLLDIEA